MAKRGRKRKGYFYEEEEQAVVDYIHAETQSEKDRIFNTILKPAFTKMIESIIRRYKLIPPDEEFYETFNDTISFLMTKINKFNPDKGCKAFSYCGTICKRYLLWKIDTFNKLQSREESFTEGFEPFQNNSSDQSTQICEPTESDFLNELIESITSKIRKIINEQKEPSLSHNEQIVGMALINLFENWEDLEEDLGSNKFNKSAILLYLKELTRFDTQTIRASMKKYKAAYYEIKKLMIQS